MQTELEKLRQEITELKEWIDTLDTFIGKLDKKGNLIFCNEAPLKAAGIKAKDMYEQYFPDTPWFSHSKEERNKIVKAVEKAKQGIAVRIETSIKDAKGAVIPIIFNAQPVIKEGKLKYITVEGKIIIKEKRLQEELEKAKQNLEEQVKKRTAELLQINKRLTKEIARYKRAKERLRRLGKEYKTIFEALGQPIMTLTPDMNIIDINQTALKLLGKTKNEIRGEKCYKVFHGLTAPPPNCPAQKIINSRLKRRIQTEMDILDRTFLVSCTPVFSQTGQLERIIHVATDITEQKQIEEALRESEEKYRNLVESSSDGFVIIQDGKFVFVNKAMCKLTNYSEEQLVGNPVTEFIPPEERERALRSMKEVMQKGPIGLQEYQFKTHDGEIRCLQVMSSRILHEGKPALQTVVRDITEQKQMEEALIAEKERLAITLSSIGDGVIVTDAKGEITMMNEVAEVLTGWKQQEAVGKPLHQVFHIINEHTRKRCENPFEKVIRIGGVVGLANDTVLIAKDGTERVIADSGAPIKDRTGEIIGVIIVFRDVTEKRKIERELIKADKLESLGILAGGIAHDFNNILTAILGNITLAKISSRPIDEVIKRLEKAEKACLRGKDLTHQLLTFAKGGEPVKKIISIAELVKESSSFALSGSNVRCEFFIPDDLWFVEADEGQISQVIHNVVINADQAMPRGGIIQISCENVIITGKEGLPLKEGKYVKISIKDQGVGIPNEYLPKIFDPFFTTKRKGSGLGLATAYSVVKRHDGHIFAESEVGVGTTFYIYLPAVSDSVKAVEEEIGEEFRSTGRILVMDDEEMILEIVKEMLEQIGYEVKCAKDGHETIKLYQKAMNEGNPFDAVILDLTIPGGMGGKETIKKLLEIDSDVKGIVSSGYSTDPVMADYEKYGFCAVIAKPYKMKELAETLQKVIKDKK